MKKILLLLFATLTLHASTPKDTNTTINYLEKVTQTIDSEKLLEEGSEYIQSIKSHVTKEKALKLYEDSISNVEEYTSNIATMLSKFSVEKAKLVTYDVQVKKSANEFASGTAVAISSDGQLITAHHVVNNFESISVINSKGERFNAEIGKVSVADDLAYLHIKANKIAYAPIQQKGSLGDDIYVLSHKNLLLKGIIAQDNEAQYKINVEVPVGASGSGLYNNKNELLGIVLSADILNNISLASKANIFSNINEPYKPSEQKPLFQSDNYDTSHCDDLHDLKIWSAHAKSPKIEVQELHALFIGLCQKVKNRDLTTDVAQLIFERARERLLK